MGNTLPSTDSEIDRFMNQCFQNCFLFSHAISAYNLAVNPFWIDWRDWIGFPLRLKSRFHGRVITSAEQMSVASLKSYFSFSRFFPFHNALQSVVPCHLSGVQQPVSAFVVCPRLYSHISQPVLRSGHFTLVSVVYIILYANLIGKIVGSSKIFYWWKWLTVYCVTIYAILLSQLTILLFFYLNLSWLFIYKRLLFTPNVISKKSFTALAARTL
jgi:hypothetical protein